MATSAMPLVADAVKGADSTARGGAPAFVSKPFFDPTNQSSWISVSSAPPAGAWQLAPSGLQNPFVLGNDRLFGDAVYSTRERKMRTANEPNVVVCRPTQLSSNDTFDKTSDTIGGAALNGQRFLPAGTIIVFQNGNTFITTDETPQAALPYIQRRNLPAHYNVVIGVTAADVHYEEGDCIPVIFQGEANMRVPKSTRDFFARFKIGSNMNSFGNTRATIMQSDSGTNSEMIKIYIY